MKRNLTLIFSILAVCNFCVNGSSSGAAYKIRAGYLQIKNIDVLPKMAQAGMNTALVKFNQVHIPLRNDELKLLKKWAMACKKAGLKFMPVINLWGYYERFWIQPKYHLYYDGIEFSQTPCPLEAEVYRRAVHQRVLELARLSRSVPIAGVMIDLEMYGANVVHFPDYCLCDYCFERFLAGKTVPEPLPLGRRQNYLKKTKQIDAYRIFTSNYIEQLARKTKQQAEVIAPQFLIGALHLDLDKPYNRGLAKGLGSDNNPALAFTEKTYSTGYIPYIHKTQKRFRDSGTSAKLVVGIWQDKFPPENLAEQYYHCAKDSAGYWIYTTESFSAHTKKTLPFDRRRYWQAIRKANDELDKLVANPKYKSRLKIRPFKVPTKPIALDKITVEPVEYVRAGGKIKVAGKTVALRFFNKLVFVAQRGDELNFEINFDKKRGNDKYDAEVVLISRDGDVLSRDKAGLLSNGRLKATATYSGSYAIVIETYGNAVNIVSFSHPYCVDAGRKAHLLKPGNTLYLYKPADSRSAKIEFAVDGVGESVTATFKNQAGQVLGMYDIVSKETIAVPLGANPKDEVIELNIKPRAGAYFEDVLIKVDSGLGKYISPFKNGVLRRKN